MPARPRTSGLASRPSAWLSLAALALVTCLSAVAQQLPEAPLPHRELALAAPRSDVSQRPEHPAPLTLRERFVLQTKTSFSPLAFVVPAGEAGVTMADPPTRYPRDWSDGGGAFARNYGSELGRHTTGGYAHFAAAALLREDPRYTPSRRTNYFARTLHAMAFTVVDRSDSGHRTFAASNFAGSAAAGFIGMAWEPDGFNDSTHAWQRSAVELSSFASHNLIEEFSPELNRILVKFHMAHANAALLPPPASNAAPAQP